MEIVSIINGILSVLQMFSGTAFLSGVWFYLLVFGLPVLLAAALIVLGGFGLYKPAKAAGIKHAWIAFLPFGNTYLAGEIAGEARVFNAKIKRIGLWAMLTEIAYTLISVFFFALVIYFSQDAFYAVVEENGNTSVQFDLDAVPESMRWGVIAVNVLYFVNWFVDLAVIFFFAVLYTGYFRKYYARSPFLMAFLCSVLSLRGIALFAVRNNKPVDYDAYMQARMREHVRRTDPEARYDPNTGEPLYPQEPEDPFSEFSDGKPKDGEKDRVPGGDGPKDRPDSPSDDSPFSDFE